MSFHSEWQSGQLLSRATTDLSAIRRFFGFGMLFLVVNITQVVVTTLVLLHLYWPLGLVVAATVGADRVALDALREGLRRRLARRPGPAGRPRHPGRGGCRRHPGDQVVRPLAPRLRAVRRRRRGACSTPASRRSGCRRGSGPSSEMIPNLAVVVVLLLGAIGVGRGALTPGDAGRLHHPDAVAGLAGRLARRDPGDGPGGDDRGRPGARDLRHRARHRRRARPTARRAARPPALRARRLHLPRLRHPGPARRQPRPRPRRDGRPGRRHRLRQDHAHRAGPAALRRHRRPGHHRRRRRPRLLPGRAALAWSRPRSRSRRCSR